MNHFWYPWKPPYFYHSFWMTLYTSYFSYFRVFPKLANFSQNLLIVPKFRGCNTNTALATSETSYFHIFAVLEVTKFQNVSVSSDISVFLLNMYQIFPQIMFDGSHYFPKSESFRSSGPRQHLSLVFHPHPSPQLLSQHLGGGGH